ncbi:Solute carrier 26 [Chytriomyces hyalinus]|nr:Solute carrier 26 [Chytriomyces hyalinus]
MSKSKSPLRLLLPPANMLATHPKGFLKDPKQTALESGVSKVAMMSSDEVVKIQDAQSGGDTQRFIRSLFPLIDQMKTYNRKFFLDDVISSFTIAFILLPQAIAYTTLAKVGVMQACVAAMFPLMFYPILGASRQLSVGPEAVVAVVTGSTVVEIMASTSAYTASQIASSLAFMVGVVCMGVGICRGGFVDNILSGYLLVGFVLGISNLICIEQIPGLLGLTLPPAEGESSALDKLQGALNVFGTANGVTAAVGISNVIFLLAMRRIKKMYKAKYPILGKIPDILVLVILMIGISAALDLNGKYKVKVLGTFDNKLPIPGLPLLNGDLVGRLIQPAFITLLVGFVESQTVTKKFGLHFGYFPSGDQELVALGSINLVSSLAGGMALFGSLPRSRILVNMGAKTVLANAMAGIIVLVATQVLGPVLKFLPKPTLSGIVFAAALGLIEFKEIGFVFRIRSWAEVIMFLITWAVTIGFAITTGIIVCLGFSALLIIRRSTEAPLAVIGRVKMNLVANSDEDDGYKKDAAQLELDSIPYRYQDLVNHPYAELLEGVVAVRIMSRIMFYNIANIRRQLRDLIHAQCLLVLERRKGIRDSRMSRNGGRNNYDSAPGDVRYNGHPSMAALAQDDDTAGVKVDLPGKAAGDQIEDDPTLFNTLVLDFRGCTELDAWAVFLLHNIFHSFEEHGVRVVICGMRDVQIQMFKRAGWYEDMAEDLFPSVEQGMAAIESRIQRPRWYKKRW